MEARSGPRHLTHAHEAASPGVGDGDWRSVDWQAPWYRAWSDIGQPVLAACGAGQPLWQALNATGRATVRFVPARERYPGRSYEAQVRETGCCPTRDDGHDAFNGLCWLRFPRAKSMLNRLHVEATARAPAAAGTRGRLRDALTLLDESGALLAAPEPLAAALAAKDWTTVFITRRALWREARVELFGHALLDRLRRPYPAITAHVLTLPDTLGRDADIDDWLASRLQQGSLTPSDYLHLPLLGIPGWWPANEDPAFYADARVFRSARAAAPEAPPAIPHPLRAYGTRGH